MKIMLDTNVLLDILLKREPFFQDSYRAVRTALEQGMECCFSAAGVTDIFYILRKALGAELARAYLREVTEFVTVADVLASDIDDALDSQMSDFEDAVVDAVAVRLGAEWILTRNERDFSAAQTSAISPTVFLNEAPL